MVNCTNDNPDKSVRSHPDAKEVDCLDGWGGGDIATYECPNCGLRFTMEIAQ